MGNLTIAVDDEILLRARKRALDQGTSVNAVLREYLETYAGRLERRAAMQRFVVRARSANVRSKRSWTREDLHER